MPSVIPTGQSRLDYDIYGNGKKLLEIALIGSLVFGSLVSLATQLKQVESFNIDQGVFDTIRNIVGFCIMILWVIKSGNG